MPELPEVETLARELKRAVVGQTIKSVTVRVPKMVLPLTADAFAKQLRKKKIVTVARRAKIVVISLSDGNSILVHLKMTGQLIFVPKQGKMVVGGHPQQGGGNGLPNRYTHVDIHFSNGSTLYFNDLRKFGWMKLVTPAEREIILSPHGVEPLSRQFTSTLFTELLTKYPRRTIKQTLLDQSLIAGLGNIYVDEASFLARVLPTRRIASLAKSEITKLHQGILDVLKLSIKKKGTSARNYVRADGTKGGFVPFLNVYGRAKQDCKRCGDQIRKTKHAGRGTHYCPVCQK